MIIIMMMIDHYDYDDAPVIVAVMVMMLDSINIIQHVDEMMDG